MKSFVFSLADLIIMHLSVRNNLLFTENLKQLVLISAQQLLRIQSS